MGYIIQYAFNGKVKSTTKAARVGKILCSVIISVAFVWVLILLQCEWGATVDAFEAMAAALGQGSDLPDALEVFCMQLLTD